MKKLLIIVDYQYDFVNGSLGFEGAEKLIPVIKTKIENYLKENQDIIYTLDTHEENYLSSTMEGKLLPIAHCLRCSKGWKVVDEVDYLDRAIKVFEKPTFPSLELANYLKDKEYDEVELCGLVSNICVLSNAVMVKSSLPNASIIVDAKATDSFNKDLHEKCLDILEGLHIQVINR